MGLRRRGRGSRRSPRRRFLPLRQRNLARQREDPARQARLDAASRDDGPHRGAAAPDPRRSGRGRVARAGHAAGQGRRVLQVLHGRGAHRAAGHRTAGRGPRTRAPGPYARRTRGADGSCEFRLPADALRHLRHGGPEGPEPVRGLSHAVRARAARPRLLPEARVRGDPHGVPGVRGEAAGARRLAGSRCAGEGRRGLRGGCRSRELEQGPATRRRGGLQPDDGHGPAEARIDVRLARVLRGGRPGRPRARGRQREECVRENRRRLRQDARGDHPRLAGVSHRGQRGALSLEVVHGRAPRAARPVVVRAAAAEGALEARRHRRRGRRLPRRRPIRHLRHARLRRRAAVYRAPLRSRCQGEDRGTRREPQGGVSRPDREARLDEPGHEKGSAAQARHLHDQGRLSGQSSRLFEGRDPQRRPARQRAPGRRGRLGLRHGTPLRAGGPERLVHDSADERRLQRGAPRHRLPGRHPAGANVRRERRPGRELRRDRGRDRPRTDPRLR